MLSSYLSFLWQRQLGSEPLHAAAGARLLICMVKRILSLKMIYISWVHPDQEPRAGLD